MVLRYIKRTYNRMFLAKPSKPPFANHVAQIGDPVLRNKAFPIDDDGIRSKEIQNLISVLKSTIKRCDLIGLAAPQVGIPLQLFVINFPHPLKHYSKEEVCLKQMEHVEQQVWINPEVKILDHTIVTFNESCASFKGYSADVPRYSRILLTGVNENGETQKLDAKGWTARIIQHEMDHLDGIMFSDRMIVNTLCCTGWDTINKFQGFVELRYEN
ncbi:peptide deformylase, mitochondrial-like [Adelges cooleyi]|uniref:peptide deformylase, mitochondrial-like n=1 Tax=Adelges cooleyi TaxID=133065 RepID=UPI0021806750|nr:peptide deformylase, mitochondrial-like [Adelges cooleyi]